MNEQTTVSLRAPYLIMLADVQDAHYAKTGLGIAHWQRDKVAGQLRFADCKVDLGVPEMSIAEAREAGVGSLVIGVAPSGGAISDNWWPALEEAARAGLDVVSGLHVRLNDSPRLVAAAKDAGVRLVDVRVPPAIREVGTGRKRTGRRVLTVGADCAIGKKYSALALAAALRDAGVPATFRATGQTGIMIAGTGIPIDSVVSDFVSGAAELLSPDNYDDHWDVIEGQGSLFHPSYAAVSLGLLHGSQPDAIVVCHEVNRDRIDGLDGVRAPTVTECIEVNLTMARITNPAVRCIGVCINTSQLSGDERGRYLTSLREATGLPCVDPLIDGVGQIVAELKQQFPPS